ncbi:RES family NAD+ phosphorylase [Vibrio coralliilyticus]|uniref:RES domain-containing protein n=1 Tax=Vibrio coralliilyticus TaxID=190893 RepID=A0AAN0VY92_9VIBR|nr:HEPN-associated N-terminal domain-containing protein [Vibrio coralliilyticus]AIW20152.1 hypothetical protein IX92_14455 [Vibrio coralliilyticus]NOH38723.1 RES family NAD+ phosphorylase [Vibrio coralliilyticus]
MEGDGGNIQSLNNKLVCAKCVGENDLIKFVHTHGRKSKCSYCKNRNAKVVNFYAFKEFIHKCIQQEYLDAEQESLPYEYIDKIYSSEELIIDVLGIPFNSLELQSDIIASLGDGSWCHACCMGMTPTQAHRYSWDTFISLVKHKCRHTLYSVPHALEYKSSKFIPAITFLTDLDDIIRTFNLYTSLPVGSTVFRARIHSVQEHLITAKSLGSVSAEKAIYANRMSPAGIPMFYGAFNQKTAINEIYDAASMKEKQIVTIGSFTLKRQLQCIDFSNVPTTWGFFSGLPMTKRHQLNFLYAFLEDFCKSIDKDKKQHIEYIPTQVVSEHIRYIHKGNNVSGIDGIIYPSSKNDNQNAIVIFCGNDDCVDKGDKGGLLELRCSQRRKLP